MPTRCQLQVSAEHQAELRALRAHAPQPYLRERAAVVLAIVGGASIRQAARTAGLLPHDADTVCTWVARYRAEGVGGLRIRKGRGRKPASFPASTQRGGG